MQDFQYYDSFTVIGIEARTNNAAEMGPTGIIPKQWEKFMTENLLEQIPNRADRSVIAGYTNYMSDKDGDYTFFLGAKVTSANEVPEGMVIKYVPAGGYRLFTTEKGPGWEVVSNVWKKIWNLPASEVGAESSRSYQFDYEVYDQRCQDPMNAIVDVYLGVNGSQERNL